MTSCYKSANLILTGITFERIYLIYCTTLNLIISNNPISLPLSRVRVAHCGLSLHFMGLQFTAYGHL